VLEEGQPIAAIEVKSHRLKRHNKYLLETLAMTSLLSRESPTAILTAPDSWGDAIEIMAGLIQDLRLENLRLATSEDGEVEPSQTRFRYISESPRN
jgi:hypothetical protein